MSATKIAKDNGEHGARGARDASERRGIWCACWAASLLALLPGCGAAEGPYEAGEDEDVVLGALDQPITGGTLTNGAFPAVVRLLASRDCTATKIGDFKFLTAAHCVDGNPADTRLDIIDVTGVQRSLTIPSGGIQMHPSWTLLEAPGSNGAPSARSYDVAVITTTTSTPTLPTLLPIPSSAVTRQPITVTGVGFGCDNLDPSHTGRQQSALFDLTLLNGTHTMTDVDVPANCAGDSGGPGLNSDNRIIGVMGQGVDNAQTFFMRMSNFRTWVLNPVPGNDASLFQGGSVYFMHNRPATPGLLGLCMASSASSGSNVPVQLSECGDGAGLLTGGRGPLWTLIPSSTAGRFVLVNSPTGGCLAVPNGAANANLRIETCAANFANDRQKWSFTTSPNPSGFPVLRIRNHSSGLCIRSENNSTALGTLVEQTPCDAGTSTQANTGQSWVAMRQ